MVGLALAHTELSGFDAGFSAEELSAQGGVNRFAAEVMRPIGRELDRMTPDTAYQKGSPFWDFHRAFASLGIGSDAIGALDARAAARMEAIVISELGWGDAGLAVSAGAGEMPMRAALASGERELVEMCTGKLGCWAATQPDRGSDGLMLYADERHPGARWRGAFARSFAAE